MSWSDKNSGALRERRFGDGLCVRCGQRPFREGIRHCDHCIQVTLQQSRQRSLKQPEIRQIRASRGLCVRCGAREAVENARWCQQCRDTCNAYQQEFRRTHQVEVRRAGATARRRQRREARTSLIEMYGGRCVCCGDGTYEFLTIDHINRDGAADRRRIGADRGRASGQYRKLLKEGRRDDLQLLCANCHFAKDLFGGCPHARKVMAVVAA